MLQMHFCWAGEREFDMDQQLGGLFLPSGKKT
jgi:hypothetical protein